MTMVFLHRAHDPGKYDPGKLNDHTYSMTALNYDVPSLDLVKWLQ